MSSDNTKHCYIKLPNKHTPEFIEKLRKIGMFEPVHTIEGIPTGDIKSDYAFIFPKRYVHPTNSAHNHNISPVKGINV